MSSIKLDWKTYIFLHMIKNLLSRNFSYVTEKSIFSTKYDFFFFKLLMSSETPIQGSSFNKRITNLSIWIKLPQLSYFWTQTVTFFFGWVVLNFNNKHKQQKSKEQTLEIPQIYPKKISELSNCCLQQMSWTFFKLNPWFWWCNFSCQKKLRLKCTQTGEIRIHLPVIKCQTCYVIV